MASELPELPAISGDAVSCAPVSVLPTLPLEAVSGQTRAVCNEGSPAQEMATVVGMAAAVSSPGPAATFPTPVVPSDNSSIRPIKEILIDFYKNHNPEKVSTVDTIITAYEGREVYLLSELKKKYSISKHEPFDSYIKSHPEQQLQQEQQQSYSNAGGDALSGLANITSDISSNLAETFKVWGFGATDSSTSSGNIAGETGRVFSQRQQQQYGSSSSSSSSTPPRRQQSGTDLPSLFSSQSASNNGSTTSLNAMSGGTGSALSSSDEVLLMNRINTLVADVSRLESEKASLESMTRNQKNELSALRRDNTGYKSELGDTTRRMESLQRNLVAVVDREAKALKELQTYTERLKVSEKNLSEYKSKFELSEKRKSTKHKQLLETMEVNQRLEGQVRHLATWVCQSLDLRLNEENGVVASIQNIIGKHESAVVETNLADGISNCNIRDSGSGSDAVANVEKQLLGSSIVTLFPEVRALRNHLCQKDVDFQVLEEKSPSALIDEILALRKKISLVMTAYEASRVELRLSMKQNTMLHDRIAEQQENTDKLQFKLDNILNDLEVATGSADSLTKQVSQTAAENSYLKSELVETRDKMKLREEQVNQLRAELQHSDELIEAASEARDTLSKLCNDRIRDYGLKATAHLRDVKAEMERERDALLGYVAETAQIATQVQLAASEETQKELNVIRSELIRARRHETQKDREIAYLQRQLTEASKRIAAMGVNSTNT